MTRRFSWLSAEPAAGFLEPAGRQAFGAFLGAGKGKALNRHAVLRSAGEHAAQPAQRPGIAEPGQQFISNSRNPQLPVFHYYLFTYLGGRVPDTDRSDPATARS